MRITRPLTERLFVVAVSVAFVFLQPSLAQDVPADAPVAVPVGAAASSETAAPETIAAVAVPDSSPGPAAAPDLSALDSSPKPSPSSAFPDQAGEQESAQEESSNDEPWDYSPYRVLVWIVSDDPRCTARSLEHPLRTYLDRDFAALWRMSLADAPAAVWSAAHREIDSMSFARITAADPVLAVKRNHPEAVRIRTAANVGSIVKKVYGTQDRILEVKRRSAASGNESIDGVADKLEPVDGDALAVRDLWADEKTEALLVSRGIALTLNEPEAKVVALPIEDLVVRSVQSYDKIFVARIDRDTVPTQVRVVELDTLMRHFGPAVTESATRIEEIPAAVGRGLTRAFAPVVRIDDAGQKMAAGLVRAGGLIIDEHSPARIMPDDVLEPMIRKNDRNGKPIMIGPIDWAFLVVTEIEGPKVKMDYYAGRPGGLQGRKNQRTFRMALKARPFQDSTMMRLHARGDVDFPLIGYEIYEKELKSTDMTFIGRTDWNGRLWLTKTKDPMRLLYVKNGGAVLARLPIVPGLVPTEVADLAGDDMRLQAEAYIRGVQNAIVDLIAIRELLAARIRLRLKKGQMTEAQALLVALREQPTNERLAGDMGRKQAAFLKDLGTRNANQRRKVDEMFTSTRELLSKYISPKMIRELEADFVKAKDNGGKLPDEPKADAAPAGGESAAAAGESGAAAGDGGAAAGESDAAAKPASDT